MPEHAAPRVRPVALILALAILLAAAPVARAARPQASVAATSPTPVMGWTTWSSERGHPTLAKVEAEARALESSGLAAAGYDQVDVDDYWYICGSRAGPQVDRYGRWVVDPSKFPSDPTTGANGIQVLAAYVHSLGLRFGLYVTPGVPNQAVTEDTPIEGTLDTAAQIAARGPHALPERNFNACGSHVSGVSSGGSTYTPASALPIDYAAPGAQAFIDSWADEFADWGVDYLKLDGVSSADTSDIRAWSEALGQTGRPIELELSNTLAISSAPVYRRYASGWRTDPDIELDPDGHPGTDLTNWSRVSARFDSVGAWQPFSGHGGYSDLDAVEIGNGPHDGVSVAERRSYLSLWALGASPLVLGADLTQLDGADLKLLENPQVIAVDQDGIPATRILDTGAAQAFAKTEADGSVVLGLFNASNLRATTVAVNLRDAGISGVPGGATDLWTGTPVAPLTSSTYRVRLAPGSVRLIEFGPGTAAQGSETLAWQSPNTLSGGARTERCEVTTAATGVQSPPTGPCGFAGGGLVTGLGGRSGGAVTLHGVQAHSAGRYLLDVGYATRHTASFQLSVNGARPVPVVVSGTSITAPATVAVTVTLRRGANPIRFAGPRSGAPDLDNVTVVPVMTPSG